ncbi:MAG: plasmid mobilization protein [Microcystaceae cyanobacterium]
MSRIHRPLKFQLCLTPTEKELAQQKAKETGLTLSELFRHATLKRKLPQKVTDIAAQTYWELGKVGVNLNQMTYAINTAIKLGQPLPNNLEELKPELKRLENLLHQIRRALADTPK